MNRYIVLVLIIVLVIKFVLSLYGLGWGAPDRWNQDERINAALKIVTERTYYYSNVEISHPIVYYYFLLLWLLPYLLILKLTGFNLEAARSAASVSWLAMTKAAPGFASGLLIAGRSSSVILGLLTVLFTYLIAKKIFDEKTGIFSALILTLNVGLLGTNHFAKNENLSIFLIVVVLFMWTTIVNGKFSYSKFYTTCFLSGLAIGTKLDSAIILVGVIFVLYNIRDKAGSFFNKLKTVFFAGAFISLGVLLGYPRLVIPSKNAIGIKEGIYKGFVTLFTTPTIKSVANQVKFIFLKWISAYNILIAVFLFAGLALCLVRLSKMHKFVRLCFLILAAYYFVILFMYRFVYTNLVILSFPILAICAGYGFKIFWDIMADFRRTRLALSIFILLYSLFYAVKADMVFTKNDTRYFSTRWIEKNIPPGATIGIIEEPEVLFSSRLVERYAVYYLGERITYENNPYLNRKKMPYLDEAGEIKTLSGFDYAVVVTGNYMRFETGLKNITEEMLRAMKEWRLIKTFQYNEDLFFNPRPTYTCPTILIFKATKNGSAQ